MSLATLPKCSPQTFFQFGLWTPAVEYSPDRVVADPRRFGQIGFKEVRFAWPVTPAIGVGELGRRTYRESEPRADELEERTPECQRGSAAGKPCADVII